MPRGRNPRYVDQVMEEVRKRRIVLQVDIAKMFNMKYASGLENSIKKLTENNRIKRTKVKIRYKNGNLNEAWLLYMPNVDYNEVLEYEKELINRPYDSPLKNHHCYKKEDMVSIDDNVIKMSEYVKINDIDLIVNSIEGQRVVTFNDIDNLHNRPSGTSKRNFNTNNAYFIEGRDYYLVKPSDAQKYEIRTSKLNNRGTVFLTESGYYMITKSFTDALSWEVQRQLVDTYFKMKQLSEQNNNQPIPVGQIQSLDIMEMMIKEMKKDRERVDQIEEKLNKIVSILSN